MYLDGGEGHTAHVWRAEDNSLDSVSAFHFAEAGSLLFLLLHCVLQASWPMSL